MGVSPFGHLRIVAYLQLPAAFRSLSRPSSAPDAKAFTLCSFTLELSARSSDLAVLFFELLEFLRTYLSVAVKKLSLSHRSISSCDFSLVEIVFLPYFVERPIFLNIMSSISVRFYSFTSIRFSMNMVFVGSDPDWWR